MIYQNTRPIAILLAVYNGEKYLREQLDSLVQQTNHQWTLYIRDDSSTDSTRQIIKEYMDQFEFIVEVIDDKGNLGCFENFRELLRCVESDYYMFSDADDVWLPEKVQISYDFILEKEKLYPNIPILAHTDKILTDENLNVTAWSSWKSIRFNPDSISDYKYIPLMIVGGASSIFNHAAKAPALEPPPFFASHDGWLGLQTARYGKLFAIHQGLMYYRRHSVSTTSADPASPNYAKKMLRLPKRLKHHWQFASAMKTLGYGGKVKYFWYRIVVFFKIQWGRLTFDNSKR